MNKLSKRNRYLLSFLPFTISMLVCMIWFENFSWTTIIIAVPTMVLLTIALEYGVDKFIKKWGKA